LTRGRKPAPLTLRILRGNPSKRALPRDVPEPLPAAPACPAALSPAANREWKRIAAELLALGILGTVDRQALALLCEAYATWDKAMSEVRRSGFIVRLGGKTVTDPLTGEVTTTAGYPQQNPWVAIANKAFDQVAKMSAEFGMTPSSRTRVRTAGGPARASFEEWERAPAHKEIG
jgi:P27 family predicted phage terminase small subunit